MNERMIETDWARHAAMTAAAFLMLAGAARGAAARRPKLRDRGGRLSGLGFRSTRRIWTAGGDRMPRDRNRVARPAPSSLAVIGGVVRAINARRLQWTSG